MKGIYNTAKLGGIWGISSDEMPPVLQKVKNRVWIWSPTVNAGLEPESVQQDFDKVGRGVIGKGGFGEVWSVKFRKTNQLLCIKVIAKQAIIEQKLHQQMNREIEIMYWINHPHCLKLKNHFEDDDNFYWVMPIATKGQLYKALKKQGKFDERQTAQVLRETISAIQYLHSFKPPIIHRDIKPENLLLNEQGRILLADFGWSNFNEDEAERKTFCGTPEYIAPEMWLKLGHDHRVDIWSIGVLMFELLAGYSPFSAKTTQDWYQNIKKLKIRWPADMTAWAKNWITRILKLKAVERPSLEEIWDHQWFKKQAPIKNWLTNDLHTQKDLLMYHMMNPYIPEWKSKINKLWNWSGDDSEKDYNYEKTNMKDVKRVSIIQEIQNKITTNTNSNTISSATMGINICKEEIDTLKAENHKLNKEVILYKTKIFSHENEIRNWKAENYKWKELNSGALQEQIKSWSSEIERWQIMDKERLKILSSLEENNKTILEFKSKIQMMESDKSQWTSEYMNWNAQFDDCKKLNESKDVTIDLLNKKISDWNQQKEDMFIDYQKKIELLQLKIFDSPTTETNEDSLGKVIEIWNETINDFKNMFKKKFDFFIENFNQFKWEYLKRDEKFMSILNEKSILIIEQTQKFVHNVNSDVQRVFEKANLPNSNIKDQKIEWLNKQVQELSDYKKKGLEYERKIQEWNSALKNWKDQNAMWQSRMEISDKALEWKHNEYQKWVLRKNESDDKFANAKSFIFNKFSEEDYEKFIGEMMI